MRAARAVSTARASMHTMASAGRRCEVCERAPIRDRKSTRLNSSHLGISYAVFCLKKKKQNTQQHPHASTIAAYTHSDLIAHAGGVASAPHVSTCARCTIISSFLLFFFFFK